MTWSRPWTWEDVSKARPGMKGFAPSKAAEKTYAKQMRSVASRVSAVLAKSPDPATAQRRLREYAETIEPWARQAAANMVRKVAAKNEGAWREAAARSGIDLRSLLSADVSRAVQDRINENVKLIQSIPAKAAERVAELAHETLLSGARVDGLTDKIMAVGDAARSRAKVIALTEVSKAGTALTRARAEAVGSEGYIWRTARDGQTRPSHRAMEGRFVRWDSPPTLDGMTGHAGEFPNCRCYPEPVVHDAAGSTVASPLPTAEQERAAGTHVLRSQWERQETSQVVPHVEGEPLPGVDQARFDRAKLVAYSMNPDSPKGRSKARVWKSALGMDRRHAAMVERQIMERIGSVPAMRKGVDRHGERFEARVPVAGPNGRTVDVTCGWIYDRDHKTGRTLATAPRLVTCYVSGK